MKTPTQHIQSALLCAALALGCQSAFSQETGVTTRLMIGTASLDSEWNQHDEQSVIGVIAEYQGKHWPLAIAVDVFGAGDESKNNGEKSEAYIANAHLGARLKWDSPDNWIQPYIGAGVAFTSAEIKPSNDEDSGIGYWVGVGADIPISERFSLGADIRYSQTDVELNDNDLDAGGTQFGFTLGYRW